MLKLKNWIIVLKPFKNTFISSKTTLKTTSTSKSIRKPIFRLFRGIIVLELAFLAGGYVVWKRMNESQEFRFYMKENWPTILEGFYLNGEMLGNLNTRSVDEACWKKTKEK